MATTQATRIMPDTALLDRAGAKALCDRVLALARADETMVTVRGGVTTHLRFARNTPSTSGSFESTEVTIRSTFGRRTAAVTIGQLDEASLAEGVRRAEALAHLAPEDPEHQPVLGPQRYAEIAARDPELLAGAPAAMARGVSGCIGSARDAGLVAAGFTQAQASFTSIATSAGLFGYHAYDGAYVGQTVRTKDGTGSGWAQSAAPRMAEVDYAGVAAAAVDKARRAASPKGLAPGKYTAIFEPAAAASLVQLLMGALDARSADEGRSALSAAGGGNRVGEQLFPEAVTITSDPAHAGIPGAPWADDGLPQRPRTWIDRGVLRTLTRDRFWAAETRAEAVPAPGNIAMAGGEGSVADLIASTERGILVTSLWYIRLVDPRSLLFTGLTRDGVFLVEDGQIAGPLHNFRWNDSPLAALAGIEAMSAPVRMPPRGQREATMLVPAIRVKAFDFTSVSEAV